MGRISFRIGDAFPADDARARFITVLGMISNDWLRSTEDLLRLDEVNTDEADRPARRIALFRQQAALHHEAIIFLLDARKRFPEIDAFIDGLPAEAKAEHEQVVGAADASSKFYLGDWFKNHRNVTFHYPEMHPEKSKHGAEEITEALKEAADLESSIEVGEFFGSVRFRFADEVVVQWLPDADTQAELIAAMRESVMALARFVQRASQNYLGSRPEGTFRIEKE